MPQRFNISFINKNNEEERPVMIHRGLVGTYERFVSILLEQTKGVLPFWLAPKQITVIPATNNDEDVDYAKEINQKLFGLGFRSKIDLRQERLSKKIREAQMSKSKIQVILGEKERLSKTVSYREYGKEETISLDIESFICFISKLKASKE
nr:His/Gly/Thr/Pro-type tRNA ligase C-terminal domain-containing protein [Mycoplasmopsis cynos]